MPTLTSCPISSELRTKYVYAETSIQRKIIEVLQKKHYSECDIKCCQDNLKYTGNPWSVD